MDGGTAGEPLPTLDTDVDEDRIELDHTGARSFRSAAKGRPCTPKGSRTRPPRFEQSSDIKVLSMWFLRSVVVWPASAPLRIAPRNRTGSRGSRVPPAETTTRRPARSGRRPRAPRASTRRATSANSAGWGRRPLPVSAPVSSDHGGLEHDHAATTERRDVLLRGGVLPHLGVHRGRDHDRTARGQQDVGQQVVGHAVGGRAIRFGGGRRDERRGRPAGRSRTWGTSWTSSKTSVLTG